MGQGNRTQRPHMGLKPDPKTIYGINTVGTGKPDPLKTIYRILIGKWVALMVCEANVPGSNPARGG